MDKSMKIWVSEIASEPYLGFDHSNGSIMVTVLVRAATASGDAEYVPLLEGDLVALVVSEPVARELGCLYLYGAAEAGE